jgi:hypothetical protein
MTDNRTDTLREFVSIVAQHNVHWGRQELTFEAFNAIFTDHPGVFGIAEYILNFHH